ncbi:chloride channel protein [Aquabacterium sp. J223]|uniref:chloride channel protein n=1 Tax=Aquabacterium sp. J223 TaxID=2898431 RepID=UPI0021AD9C1B|nr:chloride channel protein [Aquabacterium sp. J223]UUX97585.1 chloride channel protein [Aquabacterium sp. J223]
MSALWRDWSDWRAWAARAVVLAGAAAAGLAVVGFVLLSEAAAAQFDRWRAAWPWLPLLLTPLLTAAVVAVTSRWWPAVGGSGIPQVMVALAPEAAATARRWASLPLSAAKALLTSLAMAGGLAVGREGPAVQIAAGVMQHAARWLPRGAAITPHGLLVAGGAVGVAAAFNAPLAGVLFAIEQLSRRLEEGSGLLVAAIVLGGLMAVSVFGNGHHFGVISVPPLSMALVGPGLAVTLACGLAGGLFARLLVASLCGGLGRFGRWRRQAPVRFAAACGLGVALVGLASGGAAFGSGHGYTRALLAGEGESPGLMLLLRAVSTWLSVWSGAPGGVFSPALALGAGLGHDLASLWAEPALRPALIAMGMAAFLAAVTQAPVTAFIVVMEMVDGHAMVLSLMAAALVAGGMSRSLSPPLYASVAQALLARGR